MKNIDTKRMVYSFYINDKSFEHPINQLHFKLLERYIQHFDEVIFCIIIDDRERYDLIQRIEEFVISIFHKKLTFKIYDNTNYRESLVFYNEIAKKIETLDGCTFFGHNKGISDDLSERDIKMWVTALYYFNFENEIPELNGFMTYGALKGTDLSDIHLRRELLPKHKWFYCGTFFWAKYQEVHRYCVINDIKLPLLRNRWYSEMFMGELMTHDYGLSYGGYYTIECGAGGRIKMDDYFKMLFWNNEKLYDDFITFFNYIDGYESSNLCNL